MALFRTVPTGAVLLFYAALLPVAPQLNPPAAQVTFVGATSTAPSVLRLAVHQVYGFAIYGVVQFFTGFKQNPFDADLGSSP